MDGTTKRRSAVEQFSQRGPRHEPEVKETLDAYQEARQTMREVVRLQLRLVDGTIESLDYLRMGRITFEPQGRIIIRHGRVRAVIEGKNLHRLFSAVDEHRRRFVQEGTEAEEGLKPEESEHVDKIYFEENEEES